MGSRKKVPSFDIPDVVRQAGQSGWVYRTGDAPEEREPRKATPQPHARAARQTPPPMPAGEASPAGVEPAPASDARPPSSTVAGGLVGLGLQIAAVPLVVPLFITAAVSRRLGITGDQ